MRGKVAKELRKDAYMIASETYHKTSSIKEDNVWDKECPIGVYRRLKREYKQNKKRG